MSSSISPACDCHMHFFDARFPMAPGISRVVPDASISDYRPVQAAIGTGRVVVVQPSTYGTDNRCTLEAVAALGDAARAIAVVDTTVTDAELARLDTLGVKGIRFNLVTAGRQATTPDMIVPLAQRIAPFRWHVQVFLTGDQIVSLAPIWKQLPVPVVFDHFARIPMPAGTGHAAFRVVADLLGAGRAWVKLSGAYHFSASEPPHYPDTVPLAEAFTRINPENLVWGSDWPHVSHPVAKSNPTALKQLCDAWLPDHTIRQAVLIDNPARLYGFAKA